MTFRSFRSTVTPLVPRRVDSKISLLLDPNGSPVGFQSTSANGPDGIWTPTDLTAGQIASPSADIIADLNATYRLNVAPYTRYQSTGAALVPVSSAGSANLSATQTFTGANTFGDGTAASQITFNGAAGTAKGIQIKNAGVTRWQLLTDASDNINLFAFDGSGAFLNTAWRAGQSTGQVQFNYQIITNNQTSPASGGVSGTTLSSHNNGTNAAYGSLVQYTSISGGAGFDTGLGVVAVFDPVFSGAIHEAHEAIYFVACSPHDTTHTWGGNIGEMNYVNRGGDTGFKRDRFAAGNNTGGLLFVPESIDLSGEGFEGKNVGYGFAVAHSTASNSTGFPAKTYIAFNVEQNSVVGLTGRAFYATGDVSGVSSQYPYGPLQTDATWLHGIDHTLATYIDGNAETFLVGQSLAWIVGTTGAPTATATITASGSGVNASLTLTAAGTGGVAIEGTGTNDAANAGFVGEYLSNVASDNTTATVTISVATPSVITWTGHGQQALTPVYFSTTGALPTGLTAFTSYYITAGAVTANTFQLSTTMALAIAGTSIATSGTQSGVHTIHMGAILVSGTSTDILGLQLPAGDYDVEAAYWPVYGGATSVTAFNAWLSTSAASVLPTHSQALLQAAGITNTMAAIVQPVNTTRTGTLRVSLALAGMVVLAGSATYTVSSVSLFGFIRARRAR